MRNFEAVRRLAAKQAGAISRSQLLELGFTPSAIKRAVASRSLAPLHRGVFRLSLVADSLELRMWAALLRVGDGAVLSHATAGWLWRLDGLTRDAPKLFDVTLPAERIVQPARNFRVHRTRILVPVRDFGTLRGFPCTSLPRTLVDLAGVLSAVDLEVAFDSALRRAPEHRQAVLDALERLGRRPGSAKLEQIAASPDLGRTASALESRVRAIIREAQIPLPLPQLAITDAFGDQIGVFDFAWPERMLVVFCDSWEFHGGRDAFENDRRQCNALRAIGWNALQVTHRRLDTDKAGFLRELVGLLKPPCETWSA